MKTLMNLLLTAMLTITATGQDRFAASIKTEPKAYKDGLNIGFGLMYQNNFFYAEASAFLFPDLNGASYEDVGGSFGLNWRDRFLNWRVYGGYKAAAIFRAGNGGYALMGFEAGAEYYLKGESPGPFIGIGYYGVNRSDPKFWSPNDDSKRYNNGIIKMGWRW